MKTPERLNLVLMLALTFSTGIIDAVGYLGLDRVFTGNMTGNVVVLGMALTGTTTLPVVGPILALVGFMSGAAVGGRVLKQDAGGWTRRSTLLFSGVGSIMAILAVVMFVDPDPVHPLALAVTALLGVAMGAQAATARHIAVKDVTTVVVTSTLTGLAADSVVGAGKRDGSGRRFLAVALILLGALTGAALLHWHLGAGLTLAAVITLSVTVTGAIHHPRLAAADPILDTPD